MSQTRGQATHRRERSRPKCCPHLSCNLNTAALVHLDMCQKGRPKQWVVPRWFPSGHNGSASSLGLVRLGSSDALFPGQAKAGGQAFKEKTMQVEQTKRRVELSSRDPEVVFRGSRFHYCSVEMVSECRCSMMPLAVGCCFGLLLVRFGSCRLRVGWPGWPVLSKCRGVA